MDVAHQTFAPAPTNERYAPEAGYFDEAFDGAGAPRVHYADLIGEFARASLPEIATAAQNYVDRAGVAFTTKLGTRPFVVDPIPRLIETPEWRRISAALAQRVEALNSFVQDVYGPRRIIEAGIVPWEAVETAEYFEPDLVGTSPPRGIFTNVAGLDLVRGADGELLILEDNLRSPSGLTYSLAARQMSHEVLSFMAEFEPLPVGDVFQDLYDALRAASPTENGEPVIALVSDGPTSAAWYEHRAVAQALDIYLFSLDQIESHGGSIYGRDANGVLKPIDVIYRRTDLDRLRTDGGARTHYGELLLDPIRAGAVASVNAFGSGIADDKLIHAYVDEMIRFYRNEEPALRSVRTYDPGDPATLAMIKQRADELVFKPRGGLGGVGVTIGASASRAQLDEALAKLTADPRAWVAQETIALSTHPTVIEGTLEPRHVDLRPYAVHTGDGVRVLTACLTRVALERGGLIVNSSQNGGAKDTWIAAR